MDIKKSHSRDLRKSNSVQKLPIKVIPSRTRQRKNTVQIGTRRSTITKDNKPAATIGIQDLETLKTSELTSFSDSNIKSPRRLLSTKVKSPRRIPSPR